MKDESLPHIGYINLGGAISRCCFLSLGQFIYSRRPITPKKIKFKVVEKTLINVCIKRRGTEAALGANLTKAKDACFHCMEP